jgi:hypothetical protein
MRAAAAGFSGLMKEYCGTVHQRPSDAEPPRRRGWRPEPPGTVVQLKDGFTWACEYGPTDVVEYLPDHGVDASEILPRPHKQTAVGCAESDRQMFAALTGKRDRP